MSKKSEVNTKTKTKKSEPQQSFLPIHDKITPLKVASLVRNDWNPNFVTESMMKAIVDDIQKHGFIGPIVVQKYNKAMKKPFVIVNGEHRVEALRQLGEKMVPCIVLDIDDKTSKLLTVRLNREHGELMPDKVAKILGDLLEGEEFADPAESEEYLRTMTMIPNDELKLLRQMEFQAEQEDDKDVVEGLVDKDEEREEPPRAVKNEDKQDSESTIFYDWYDVEESIAQASKILKQKYDDVVSRYNAILAIPNGGLIPARLLARELDFFSPKNHHYQQNILTTITPKQRKEFKRILVVDDIHDTGKTTTMVENLLKPIECEFVYLVIRNGQQKGIHITAGRDLQKDKRWVRFPWEVGTEKSRKDIATAIQI